MKNNLAIAMEAFGFQSDAFFKELTGYFEDIRKGGRAKLEKEGFKGLDKIIHHYTRLKVVIKGLDVNGPLRYSMSVTTPVVNANYALAANLAEMFKGEVNNTGVFKKNVKQLSGFIDLKAGKVDGMYSLIESTISIPFDIVFFLTPAETAATVLHEVGHILTSFENTTRVVTTNFALKTISESILRGDDQSKREHILLDLTEAMRMPKIDVKELSKFENVDAVQVALFNNAIEVARSELGSNVYDQVGCEALADQYAARCGAYRDLVIAVSKCHKAIGDTFAYRSTARYMMFEAMKLAFVIVPFMIPVALTMTAMDSGGNSYDKPKVRFERIREQLIAEIKEDKLTGDRLKQLQGDIEMIDGVLAEVHLRPQLFEWIGNVFSSKRREKVRIEEFQRQIEKFGNNDLFLSAQKLKFL